MPNPRDFLPPPPWKGLPLLGKTTIARYSVSELRGLLSELGGQQEIRNIILKSDVDELRKWASRHGVSWLGRSKFEGKDDFHTVLIDYLTEPTWTVSFYGRLETPARTAEEAIDITKTLRIVVAGYGFRAELAE